MELAIIGGGPAGLSAAIRAKEEGIEDVLVIERSGKLGGILNQCIHHGFGLHIFKEELTGPEYAGRLIDRAKELNVRFETNAMVTDITKERTVTFISRSGARKEQASAIILAMGCRERPRGALGIPGFRGAGVYTAGTAQAFVNLKGYMPGKRAVVLGSGDIGLIMARRLTLEGTAVEGVYELMPYSGGLKRNIAQCLHDFDIPLYLSHTVTRIIGRNRVEGVYVAKVDERRAPMYETEKFVPCDTLLLSVGLVPENELSKKIGINLSPVTGGAIVNDRLETNVPGVFSCGNVLHVHDLADNVTLEAYAAAASAARYIRGERGVGRVVAVEAGRGVRYTVPSSLVMGEGAGRSQSEPPAHVATGSRAVYALREETGEQPFEVLFRSDNVYKNAAVAIYANGEFLTSVKKRIITPGEMERVRFTLKTPAARVEIAIETSEAGVRV
jgi:sarcosine oxidase subunit alpha